MNDYVAKPINQAELLDKIAHWTGQNAATEAAEERRCYASGWGI